MGARRGVPRRADAVANRTALLDAAARVLLRGGPGVALDVVAREAGVGIGTLYRNFGDREQLLAAVVARAYELVAALAAAAERSSAAPLDALDAFLAGLVEERERLALPLLGGPGPADGRIDPLGPEISRRLAVVVQRGVADGSIRADADATDLVIAGAMLAHAQLPAPQWRTAAGRLRAIVLDGLRARPDAGPLPPALTRSQLDRAMTEGRGAPVDRTGAG